MSRNSSKSTRRGVAPLEVVMILPFLAMMFVFIFYLVSTCRQHVEHLYSVRNDVWKQRYTETAPASQSYLFSSNNKTIGDEYISEDSSKNFRTGTVYDNRLSQSSSFAHCFVLTGKTWDHEAVDGNRLPNYYQEPFTRIPQNLKSLGSLRLPGHNELLDLLAVEAIRQHLLNFVDSDLNRMLDNVLKAGGTAFRDKLMEAGKKILLDQILSLSGSFLVDRVRELGGQEFLDKMIDAGVDVLCEQLADAVLRRYSSIDSRPTYLPVALPMQLRIPNLGISISYPTKAKLIEALKKVGKDRLLSFAKQYGFDTSIPKLVDLGKKILQLDLKAEGQKLLQNLEKWGKTALQETLKAGLKKLVDLVKQCKNPTEILKELKQWAAGQILSQVKSIGNKALDSLGILDTLKLLTDIFDQFKTLVGDVKQFFQNFDPGKVVDYLVSVLKDVVKEAAMSAVLGGSGSFDLGKLHLDFKFEFKFDGSKLKFTGNAKPSLN